VESTSSVQSRSQLWLQKWLTRSDREPEPSAEAHLLAMRRAADSSSGMHTADGFVRGCSRAVVVVAGAVLLHLAA